MKGFPVDFPIAQSNEHIQTKFINIHHIQHPTARLPAWNCSTSPCCVGVLRGGEPVNHRPSLFFATRGGVSDTHFLLYTYTYTYIYIIYIHIQVWYRYRYHLQWQQKMNKNDGVTVTHLQVYQLGWFTAWICKRANPENWLAFHNQLSWNNPPEMVCFEPSTFCSHFDMSLESFPLPYVGFQEFKLQQSAWL